MWKTLSLLAPLLGTVIAVDLNTAMSYWRDFYKSIETPVNRVQNLIRANLAPTLWCGVRNSAPFPEALSAIYPHLDNCCRSHDNCPLIIDRGECFEGLCNPSFITPILSCDCETEFRECLKSLPTASTLPEFPITWMERFLTDIAGFSYFGVLPRILEHKCLFRVDPQRECRVKNPKNHHCIEYGSGYTNASWELISVHRDFNHRDWFKPTSYINDVIDTSQIEDFFRRILDPSQNYIDKETYRKS